MNPVTMTESGPATPALGVFAALDRDGVAVLDDQGITVFTGCFTDALTYMEMHGLEQYCNAEIIENRGYVVGFEAF